MDEQHAIHRCLEGDKEAFAAIVGQYQAQVLALCLRMTGNREDAADTAQQAFVQAYRHLDRYDPHQPFRPWLFKIATNQCIGLLRRRKHQSVTLEEGRIESVPDPEGGAASLIDLAEDRERVRRAVAELPLNYRTVVVQYYFQQLSYQEIARQTGLSIGTISTHLHRAKQLLRRWLADEEVGTGEAPRTRTASALSGR